MPHTTVSIVIEGYDAPGRACSGPDGAGLGIQRGREVMDVAGSSDESPVFHAGLDIVSREDGVDFRGPFVHGKRGDRFLYLCWVTLPEHVMVARIKLLLNDIAPDQIEGALHGNAMLHARVRLTNAQGNPASGSCRPPHVEWAASPMPVPDGSPLRPEPQAMVADQPVTPRTWKRGQ